MKLALPALILSAAAIVVALIVARPFPEDRPPIGAVVAWPSDDLPQGWMVCDGRAMGEQEYPELFAVLGRKYGNGVDGSSIGLRQGDFNLPDYRGLFLRGVLADRQDWLREGRINLSESDRVRFDLVGESKSVGSVQAWSTAEPQRLRQQSDVIDAFVASQIEYVPRSSGQPVARDVPQVGRPDILYGLVWDRETRPANVYVNWIIRVR